jgi:hypothetical protein
MNLHPQIIEKDGKKEFVVLPYEEFLRIQEALEDFDDLKELRKEKEFARAEPTKRLDDVTREMKLNWNSRTAN